jgi:hypothetical protein
VLTSNDYTGQRLQELIEKTLELRKLWEQRRLEAERQIKVLDAKIVAYQRTLRDYWESIDNTPIKIKENNDSE